MIGNLEGVEVDRKANMKLDEEGGARTTDSKTRYLSTGLAVLLAAAAAHPDAEHGTVDAGGRPGRADGGGRLWVPVDGGDLGVGGKVDAGFHCVWGLWGFVVDLLEFLVARA